MNYCVLCYRFKRSKDSGWNFSETILSSQIFRKTYSKIETICDRCITDTYNRSRIQIGELEKFDYEEVCLADMEKRGVSYFQLYELVCKKNNIEIEKN
jgi:hypothetical protein